jgi:hypothetical protein
MKEQTQKHVERLGSAVSALILIYFLTAPPLMKLSSGTASAVVYKPVKLLLENYAYGEPLCWYFESVWHIEVDYVHKKLGMISPFCFPIWVFGVAILLRAIRLPMLRCLHKMRRRRLGNA